MLGFPDFTGLTRKLVLWNLGAYFLLLILGVASHSTVNLLQLYLGLVPALVLHRGFIWQLVTYCLIHQGILNTAFELLSLWFLGSFLESNHGSRWLGEIFFTSVLGSALAGVALAAATGEQTVLLYGCWGGIFGLLIAFGVLYADLEFMMFPLPFMIKAKYFIWGIVFLTLVGAIQETGGVANFAHLGGLLFGYLYLKFMPRKGLTVSASEKYFNVRNGYYRWRRRRAARKFEVYMRKHDRDVHFDEHGNYIPPDDDLRKGNGGSKSGWVN